LLGVSKSTTLPLGSDTLFLTKNFTLSYVGFCNEIILESTTFLNIYVGSWSRIVLLANPIIVVSLYLGVEWYVICTSHVTLTVHTTARIAHCTAARFTTVPSVLGSVGSFIRARAYCNWLVAIKPL